MSENFWGEEIATIRSEVRSGVFWGRLLYETVEDFGVAVVVDGCVLLNLFVRDELTSNNGGGIWMCFEGRDEVRNGGTTEDYIVRITDNEGFIVTDEIPSAGNRRAVTVWERRILSDNSYLRKIEDVLNWSVTIFLALRGELFSDAV